VSGTPPTLYLPPLPILQAALIGFPRWKLRRLPRAGDGWTWPPFAAATALFVLAYGAMAYSFYR